MIKKVDYSEWDKAMANIFQREDEKIPTTTPNQHCLDVVVDKRLRQRRRTSATSLTLSMSTESSIETSVLLESRRQVVATTTEEEENVYYIYTCDDDSCISSLQDSIYPKKKDEEDDLDWERLESFMDNDFLNDDKIEECYDALVHLHKIYKDKNEKKNKTSMKSSTALHRRPVFASPQVDQYRIGRRCPAA